MATNSIYIQAKNFSQPIEIHKRWADWDLHASAVLTEIEWDLSVSPNVLREFGAFFHVKFDFIHFVVRPSGCVAPTDCTLAFVDFLWLMRHDHGDGATMAGGFEGFVRHLNPKVRPEQSGTRRFELGTGTGVLVILSREGCFIVEEGNGKPSTASQYLWIFYARIPVTFYTNGSDCECLAQGSIRQRNAHSLSDALELCWEISTRSLMCAGLSKPSTFLLFVRSSRNSDLVL